MFWPIFSILVVSAFSLPLSPVTFPSQETPVDPTTTVLFPTIYITSKSPNTTGGFTLPRVTSEHPTTTEPFSRTTELTTITTYTTPEPYESSTTPFQLPTTQGPAGIPINLIPPVPRQPGIPTAPEQPGTPTNSFSPSKCPGQAGIPINLIPPVPRQLVTPPAPGQPGIPTNPFPSSTCPGQPGIPTSPGQAPVPQGPFEIPNTSISSISSPSEKCLFSVMVSPAPNSSEVARFLEAVLDFYQLETIPAQQRCRAVNHNDIIDITLKFTKDPCYPPDAQQLVDVCFALATMNNNNN